MPKGYDFSPLEAFQHAERLRQAALSIGWISVEWSRLKGDVGEAMVGMSGQTTLLALSIEIYFKCLGKLSGKSLGGHKLLDLFLKLDRSDQAAIEQRFVVLRDKGLFAHTPLYFPPVFRTKSSKGKNFDPLKDDTDIKALLNDNNDAFIEWRYSYERGRQGTATGQLSLVARAAREYIAVDKKPEWSSEMLHDNWTKQMAAGERPTRKRSFNNNESTK